ncbi:fatty acid hydroxylase superfamily-domain-containing protein [Aspergillus pseudodeflectus]|uniref:Fatty acid hydroxylase superfamily-domain-containing protein n=1 Tax=Aspergillus pseudodeflectus TaxID=176178 RepID=A0ABR4JBQ5_9EURO
MSDTKTERKDSMKSTWRTADRSQWTIYHRLLDSGGLHHVDLDREIPTFPKMAKVPYLSDWQLNRFIIFYSVVPFALHELYVRVTGHNLRPIMAYMLYYQATKTMMTQALHSMKELGHTVGFLDGDKHERDGVPDVGVKRTFIAMTLAGLSRMFAMIYLTYSVDRTPAMMNWKWIVPVVGLYAVTLDFWFYWYHRLMHEIPILWKFHRTHHLTKHPNMLLAGYADFEQEVLDAIGIPLLTFFSLRAVGVPFDFYTFFACVQTVTFSEVSGHSGVRMYASAPGPLTWLWRLVDAELIIEDHDLHHRIGYRKSHNYGKQTRVWDRVFGTCYPRVESILANVDYDQRLRLALW